MRIWIIVNGLNIVLLQSLLVLVALVACVFAAEQDQEAAEQYFFKYGYYPSWYTSATHFAAPASTFKAYPSYAYSYPGYHYGAYPYSYFPGHYAAPVAAVAEKKVEEKSAHRATRSADNQDQETAEQYFAKYGYYPSWYTATASHFVAQPYSYVAPVVATEKKTEIAEKTAVEAKYYPSYYPAYPGYGFAAPAAYKAGEKYVAPAVPHYPFNGNYHYGAQYFY